MTRKRPLSLWAWVESQKMPLGCHQNNDPTGGRSLALPENQQECPPEPLRPSNDTDNACSLGLHFRWLEGSLESYISNWLDTQAMMPSNGRGHPHPLWTEITSVAEATRMDTGPDGRATRPGQKLSDGRGAGGKDISIVNLEVIARGLKYRFRGC